MSFASDIKGCMRDCILGIFWPKSDIVAFFSDNGCTNRDLKCIQDTSHELSRSAMVDTMFKQLSSRPDEGLGPFRAMLQSLIKWSHFDPYYFDKLKKLDRQNAERLLNHLRQLQELRDAKLKEQRAQREARHAESQRSTQTIAQLKQLFLDLFTNKMSPQQRGYSLEKILQELSKQVAIEVTEPYRVNSEQIDGAIKYDGEHYLVEAKWQDKSSANEAVYQFAGKVEGKMYGRGLFVSVNGFSEGVIDALVHGKAIKTIFIDGEDLILVLEEQLSFSQMLDRKIKAAQTKGQIYIHPITGKVKV